MMIYISYPYDGIEENKKTIENILLKAAEVDRANTYVSPVTSFGSLYGKIDHDLWIDYSIDLLMMCDKVYFFGDIKSSLDCKEELKMCKLFKMPYKIFKGKVKV